MQKLSLAECIEISTYVAEDSKYDADRAKVPAKKRAASKNLALWTSIKEHLTELQKIKADNALNITL